MSKKTMYFQAILETANMDKLWDSISHYNRVNLSTVDSKPVIFFTGSVEDGLEVLAKITAEANNNVQLTVGY